MKAVEELSPSVGTAVARAAIGVPRATAYRHRLSKAATAPKPRPASPRAVSGEERKHVLDVLHDEIREILVKEGIHRDQLTIYSDRSPAMRSQTVA